MDMERSTEGEAKEHSPAISEIEEHTEHLVSEATLDGTSLPRSTNNAKRRSTEVEGIGDDGRSDDGESEDEDSDSDEDEDLHIPSEARPRKPLPGRAADPEGKYVLYKARLKMKERSSQDPHAAPNKKRRFKGPPTPPLPKGARRLIQDLHTLASGNASGEVFRSTLQDLFIEHNLTVGNPDGGDLTGPSTLPPLIPELRQEDDDMSGDSRELSEDVDSNEDTSFEDVEEFGYSTDAPNETEYYSADADIPMDVGGAEDQSRARTTGEPSALQPRPDSRMVKISQEEPGPEGTRSRKNHCNRGTTSPQSGSSGSGDADADAVEHQLLDPLSLRIDGAEEDTQVTPPFAVDTSHKRSEVPAPTILQGLPIPSLSPTAECLPVGTRRSTVSPQISPFTSHQTDGYYAEQEVGASSMLKDAFETGLPDDVGAKMEIDDLGLSKTAQKLLVSADHEQNLAFGRRQDEYFGSNDSTFSPQTESEEAAALDFHTPDTHSSLQLFTSQSSNPSPPPESGSSLAAASSPSPLLKQSSRSRSPYTLEPDTFPAPSSSRLQTFAPSPMQSFSRPPADIADYGGSLGHDGREPTFAVSHPKPLTSTLGSFRDRSFTILPPSPTSSRSQDGSSGKNEGTLSPAAPPPRRPMPSSSSALDAGATNPRDSRGDRDNRKSSSSSSSAPPPEPFLPPSSSTSSATQDASGHKDRSAALPAVPPPKRSTLQQGLVSSQDQHALSATSQSSQPSRFSVLSGGEGLTTSARFSMGILGSTLGEDADRSNQLSGRGLSPNATNTLGLSSAPTISQKGLDLSIVHARGQTSRAPTPQFRSQLEQQPLTVVKSATPSERRGARILATPLPQPLPLPVKPKSRKSVPPSTHRNPGGQSRRSPINEQRPAAGPSTTLFGSASTFNFAMESFPIQAPTGDGTVLPPMNSSMSFAVRSGKRSTSDSPHPRPTFHQRGSGASRDSMPGGLISDDNDNDNESPARISVSVHGSPEAKHTGGISPVGPETKGKGRASLAQDHSSVPVVPRAPLYGDGTVRGSRAGVRYGLSSQAGSDSGSDSDSDSEPAEKTRANVGQTRAEESDGVRQQPPSGAEPSESSTSPGPLDGYRQASLAEYNDSETESRAQLDRAGNAGPSSRRATATDLDDDRDDDDVPVTRRDFNQAIEVLDGVSHEVRSITQLLAKSQAGPSGAKAGTSGYDADSEDDKRTKPTKHRSDSQNQLAEDVAAHVLTLLKRKYADSPFPRSAIASQKQVKAFKREKGECCTADNFILDIGGTAGNTWNASATRVFVDDFLQANYECNHRKKLLGASKSADDTPTPEQKERSRYQRKYTMFQRRHEICTRWPAMKRHIDILERLGIEGMSSDEEDSDGDYGVFKTVWRARRATSFLRILDALHRMVRTRKGRGSQSGAKRRRRYLVDNESTSPPPRKLPRNMYASDWLKTLGKVELQELWPQSEYDITIDEDVVHEVREFREFKDKHGTVWV